LSNISDSLQAGTSSLDFSWTAGLDYRGHSEFRGVVHTYYFF